MNKLFFFFITVVFLVGCVPEERNLSLDEFFPGAKFNGKLLVNVSSNRKLLYHETFSIVISNATEDKLIIESPEDIYGFYFSDKSSSWVELDFNEANTISQKITSFPVIIESKSEAEILVNPDIFLEDKIGKIQIIVIGQSVSNAETEKFGGTIQLNLFPFEGINITSIQIKKMLPDLENRAKKWQADAYISAISLFIPSEWSPDGNVAKISFQSDSNKIEELSFSIENNGSISEQYATFFDGIIKKKPIADDLWSKDGSEIMQILVAYDSSIEIPSKVCEGINLRYISENDLEWIYYVSDCKLILKEKYNINPITGVVTQAQTEGLP